MIFARHEKSRLKLLKPKYLVIQKQPLTVHSHPGVKLY